jgi:hypothetical protein
MYDNSITDEGAIMKDCYEFSCTPTDEDCVQVSSTKEYMPAMRAEAQRMIDVCKKLWPKVNFKIHSNPHDFGSYLDIRVYFDDTDEESWNQLSKIDTEWPSTWDECNQRIANLTEKKETI